MAHIPMGDIEELWRETPQHNWSALHRTVQEHKGKAKGISDNLITMLMPITERLSKSGQQYPSSPDELYNILNREIQSHGGQERHA